jgi:Flp pilus assembly protein TadD
MALAAVGGAALLQRLIADEGQRLKAGIAVVVALALVYGGLTVRRNRDYRTPETVWEDVVAKRPMNARAHNNLGLLLSGRGDEAIAHFRRALELKPDFAEAHNNLGVALAGRGQMDEAIAHYREALESKPDYADAHNNLGIALAGRGQLDEAIGHYREALKTKPDYAEAINNLGVALAGRGQVDEAITRFRRAVVLKPDYVGARINLGLALAGRGQAGEAIAQYEEALRIEPDNGAALTCLAWMRATCSDARLRDGPQAVSLARRAIDRSAGDANALDALAAAYAETGRFAEALQTARRAADLAMRQNERALAESIQARIGLYRTGAPFHEPPPSPAATPARPS